MNHSTTHFDLIEYIRDFTQPEVAAQMAQSVAWKFDALIQQNARTIFKHVRDELVSKGVDGASELNVALREAKFAAESFTECGSGTEGPVKIIGELMYFREAIHNVAQELTALTTDWQGRPITYEIPDIEDVFFNPVNLKIKPVTHRRMAINVERRAKAYGLTSEEVQAQIAKRTQRKQDQLKEVGLKLEDQAAAVHELFKLACQASTFDPGDEFKFYLLDLATQRALIEHAMVSADRAEERAEDNDRLSDSEFDDICMAVTVANKELKAILKSPRFVTAQQVENAG